MVHKAPETPGFTDGKYGRDPAEQSDSPASKFFHGVLSIFNGPVDWFQEKIVLPNKKQDFVYYHRKYKRVPTVDQCYEDDFACLYEADEQYKRDRQVDECILGILRQRYTQCIYYHSPEQGDKCMPLKKDYDEAEVNHFIKYGDMGFAHNVIDAYMKQKHRMIFERRKAERKAQEERLQKQ